LGLISPRFGRSAEISQRREQRPNAADAAVSRMRSFPCGSGKRYKHDVLKTEVF